MQKFFYGLGALVYVFALAACELPGPGADAPPPLPPDFPQVIAIPPGEGPGTTEFGGRTIYALTFAGGKFVAGGANYRAAYSSNGTSWTGIDAITPAGGEISSIVYGGGTFIAITDGYSRNYSKILSSPDGGNWITALSPNIAPILALAYGKNMFIAGFSNAAAQYSSDNGAAWTSNAGLVALFSGLPSSATLDKIQGIAFGNNRFVAVGGSDRTAYSLDGTTWTWPASGILNIHTAFGSYAVKTLVHGGGLFIAAGEGGKMAYSPDGITWTGLEGNQTAFEYSTIHALAYGNGMFVAGGQNGKIAYSLDGINWTGVSGETTTFNHYPIYCIAYGNGKFVLAGMAGKMAYFEY